MSLSRRLFLASATAASAAALLPGGLGTVASADHHKGHGGKGKKGMKPARDNATDGKPYKISLAQWSLHRTIRAGELDPIDFPKFARTEFDIGGVEYVNQFFKDKANDEAYLSEMKKRGDDHDVSHVLIMVDGEGRLGDPSGKARKQAVDQHVKWLDAAKFLGCHSIRVNAASEGSWEQQRDHAADGLRRLGEEAEAYGLNVLVENHGGLSSNGEWLASVMKYADHPLVGTLPDFGNFIIDRKTGEAFDRYRGLELLMPYAEAVSAKTYGFDGEGNETTIDYPRMMKTVLENDYHSWVGIEWEGNDPGEIEGIKQTKALLERLQGELG